MVFSWKKFIFSLIILASCLNIGNAQQTPQADSLEQIIEQTDGHTKLKAIEDLLILYFDAGNPKFSQLSRKMERVAKKLQVSEKIAEAKAFQARGFQLQSKFDSLQTIARQGIKYCKQIKNDSILAIFYNYIGIFHEKQGSLDSAIHFYELALPLTSNNQMALNSNIGLAYIRKGVYHKSIEFLELAITEAKEKKKVNVEAIVSNNIGQAHAEIGNEEQAIYYYLRSIELKDQLNDERGKLFAISNLLRLGLPDEEAIKYHDLGLEIAEKLENPFFYDFFILKKGYFLSKKEQYQEALDIALQVYLEEKNNKGLVYLEALGLLGEAYFGLGNNNKAKTYYHEMGNLALEKNDLGTVQAARKNLLKIYSKTGEYQMYHEIAKAYYPAKDSINQQNSLEKLAYLDSQLKNIEQQKEIEVLNQTLEKRAIRRKWTIAVAILTAFILSLIIFFRNRQVKIQKQVAQKLAGVNQELKTLDEMKSRFFTNISHELRTPITLITAPIHNILNNYGSSLNQDLKNALQLVQNNGQKLLSLVEELLVLSRLDAQKQDLKPSNTPIANYIQQLFNNYQGQAQIKQIEYTFKNDLNSDTWLMVDKKHLAKIVNNLLSNAFKFTTAGGEITLSLTTLGVYKTPRVVRLRVEDSGRGIPQKDLPHIFDRYFQTRSKSIATEGGTGIGLALARELALLMGGTLSVQSEWGKGSLFTLELPFEEAEKEASNLENIAPIPSPVDKPAIKTGSSVQASNPRKEKILVVEDNPDMQALIVSLIGHKFECVIANDGLEAWNLLDKDASSIQDTALILSDIMMPHLDGYQLLERIKAHQKWQHLPVIMLTARAAEEDKLQALRMGVDDYLLKPFSPEELITRISNLIQNFQQRLAFQKAEEGLNNLHFEKTPGANEVWLKAIEKVVKEALSKKLDLGNQYLADQMALSDRQLRRKLKALTGLSTNQYIQEIKLQKARHLLENKAYTSISEIAYATGFNTPAYLTKQYEKRFGKRPTTYFD